MEKTLKGLLEFYERPMPTHDLLKISARLRLPISEERGILLKKLVKLYGDSRYELELYGESIELSEAEGRDLVRDSKDFISWAKTFNRSPST